MKFLVSSKPLNQIETDAVIAFGFSDSATTEEKLIDKYFGGMASQLRQAKDFTGEKNKVRLVFPSGKGPRVVLAGLGAKAELKIESLREAMSAACQALKGLPVKTVSLLLPSLPKFSASDSSAALTEAFLLSNYEFVYYKAPEKDKTRIEELELISAAKSSQNAIRSGIKFGQILSEAVIFARDLGNHPSNVATPSHLAEHALELQKSHPQIRTKILHRAEIQKENMGALLAVSQGSDEEPKFIVLEYRAGRKSQPPIVLVGKGITFDSGGISIKPSDKMEEMKYDMMGAATVMGTIKAASKLKMPVNLIGLIPATENLPSGKAIKPGDIIRSRSGKTIEVVNTDAEGRLILADALDYAKKYKPSLVIDFATLTGAIVVALGDDLTGAFTNQENLLPKLKAAAETTGEKIWPMPLEKDYEQFIKSDFADLSNTGSIRYGESIRAALFLQNFVDYPWIHLDIAGTAWATREKPYRPKGATGIGIRLAIEFLKKFGK